MLMLLSLYLAQGLPVGFMTQALPALLRSYGVSLTQIGISGVLMLPWAIKFLWAPLIDHYAHSRLGHYRSWILFMQACTLFSLLLLAFSPPQQLQQMSVLWGFFGILLLMNLSCATQDIATDGLAVKILKNHQLHWGNTFQVIGSRLGFIFGGGALLYAIDLLTWKSSFILLALVVVLNSLPILFFREQISCPLTLPESKKAVPIMTKLKTIYLALWQQQETRIWLGVLLSYKIADGLSGPIIKPMMVDMGLSLSQIGLNVTMLGAGFAVLGAWWASIFIKRFNLGRMLIFFSILQSLAIGYYLALAWCFEQQIIVADWHLYIANILEETFAAMSLVAMLSLIMKYSRQQFAATDFTFQVAMMTLVSGGLYMISGALTDILGYRGVFMLIFILSLVCLWPKIYWYKRATMI
ncbi:MFS transporter [Acinetobacter qingfengensis]|nr:MFS transporter [Acinetobacter qingfengensis]